MPFAKLPQPCLDGAAELDHYQIGTAVSHLGGAAQTGGSDDTARGQIGERRFVQRHEGVPDIGARETGDDGETVRLQGRHVLHRMHGYVDRPGGQRRLDLASEQPLATKFAQRPVQHPVAGGPNNHDAERRIGQAVCRHQSAPCLMCLSERELAAPGADSKRAIGARKVKRHRLRGSQSDADL